MSKLIGGALLALFVTAWPFVAVASAGLGADVTAQITDAVFAGTPSSSGVGQTPA